MRKPVLLSCLCLLLLVLLAAAPVLAATTVTCPSGCSCLLPAEAKKMGYSGYCQGQQKICGYDSQKNEKYCYQKPVTTTAPQLSVTGFKVVTTTPTTVAPQKCASGCTCLSSADGKGKGLLYCNGKQTVCGGTDTAPLYCFALPTTTTTKPISLIVTEFQVITTTPASHVYSDNSFGNWSLSPIPCTAPCTCLEPDAAKASGLSRCSINATLVCGYSAAGKAEYCYVPNRTTGLSPAAGTTFTSTLPSCPSGCACLLPSDAAKKGLSYCGGKQTTCSASQTSATGLTASGQTRYCYTIPAATGSVMNLSRVVAVNRTPAAPIPLPKACPAGCSCLDEKTIRDKGYPYCNGTKTECGFSKSGGVLYCAMTGSASGSTVGQPDNVFSAIGSFFGSLFGGKPATVVQDSSVLTSYCENRYGQDFHMCDGVCVDTLTDTNHCGGCGNWCNTDPGFSPGTGTAFHCINGECVLRSQAAEDPYSCGSSGFTDYDFYTSGRPGVIECPAEAPCLDGVCSALGCIDPGLTACNNICTRTSYDNNNCGSCGNTCSLPNQTCRAGSCYSECEEPGTGYCRSPIDGHHYCAELDSDSFHCGRCQHICPSSQLCSRGECVSECPSDLTNCMGGCADTMTSEWNCGECGNRCDRDPGGGWAEKCINGECRDLDLAYLPPVR